MRIVALWLPAQEVDLKTLGIYRGFILALFALKAGVGLLQNLQYR